MKQLETGTIGENETYFHIQSHPCYTLLIGGVAVVQSWLRFSRLSDAQQECSGWQIKTWSQIFATPEKKGAYTKSKHIFSSDGLLNSICVEEERRTVFVDYKEGGYTFSDGKYDISHIECEKAEFFLEDNNFASISGLFALRSTLEKTDNVVKVLPTGSFEIIDLPVEMSSSKSVKFCGITFSLDEDGTTLDGVLPGNDVRIERVDSPIPEELQADLFKGRNDFNEIYPVAQEELVIRSQFGSVHGTYARNPNKIKPECTAMLIGGTGRYNRDGFTLSGVNLGYGRFMDAIAYAGLPSIRYDRRPSLGAKEVLTQKEISDQARAVLRHITDVQNSRAVVIGHSYGGLVASQITQNNDNISLLVLIATPATSLVESIAWQRQQAMEKITDPGIRELYKEKAGEFDEKLKNAELDDLSHTERSTIAFIRSVGDQCVFDFLTGVNCPILILQGEDDEQVPSKHARQISDWLSVKGKIAKYDVLQRVGHFLSPQEQNASSTSELKAFDTKLVEKILDNLDI